MGQIERLYEAQNMDLGDISVSKPKKVDQLRMRAILDSIQEQLPPLLELGDVPSNVVSHMHDFPYHRPSILSVDTVASTLMPESVGFVLLQVGFVHFYHFNGRGNRMRSICVTICVPIC